MLEDFNSVYMHVCMSTECIAHFFLTLSYILFVNFDSVHLVCAVGVWGHGLPPSHGLGGRQCSELEHDDGLDIFI